MSLVYWSYNLMGTTEFSLTWSKVSGVAQERRVCMYVSIWMEEFRGNSEESRQVKNFGLICLLNIILNMFNILSLVPIPLYRNEWRWYNILYMIFSYFNGSFILSSHWKRWKLNPRELSWLDKGHFSSKWHRKEWFPETWSLTLHHHPTFPWHLHKCVCYFDGDQTIDCLLLHI